MAPVGSAVHHPKRLTLDLAVDLHRSLKVRCAEVDVPMAEVLRVLIEDALADERKLTDVARRVRGPA